MITYFDKHSTPVELELHPNANWRLLIEYSRQNGSSRYNTAYAHSLVCYNPYFKLNLNRKSSVKEFWYKRTYYPNQPIPLSKYEDALRWAEGEGRTIYFNSLEHPYFQKLEEQAREKLAARLRGGAVCV